jgi:hypothetical protein
MKLLLLRGLELVIAVTAALWLVILGNVMTMWLLDSLHPRPVINVPEPRAWSWDPFTNYLRSA